ncbi:MAG TPA: riboflavin synthase [Polyangia bacterium]|nr:riboflavin synthase [Polyangia bacterium]
MFTGLIQDIGTVEHVERHGAEARLRLSSKLGPLSVGESVAVDGACLTVTAADPAGRSFAVFASPETLGRTSLAEARAGDRVNLERALGTAALLGGHLVTGHVDARVRLVGRDPVGSAERWTLALPVDGALARQVASRGSVALEGVSLTVGDIEGGHFVLTLIPLTLETTTLALKRPGAELNLETDVLAKYVARQLERDGGGVDLDLLFRSGFARQP